MKIGLIVAIGVIVLLVVVICLLLRIAVVFTDKHNATVSAFRKAKAKIMDLQSDVHLLKHQLANAEAEIEKWKTKAIEISINAQKIEREISDEEKD